MLLNIIVRFFFSDIAASCQWGDKHGGRGFSERLSRLLHPESSGIQHCWGSFIYFTNTYIRRHASAQIFFTYLTVVTYLIAHKKRQVSYLCTCTCMYMCMLVVVTHTFLSRCSPSNLSESFGLNFQDGDIADFCHDDALYDSFPFDRLSMSQREIGEAVIPHTRGCNLGYSPRSLHAWCVLDLWTCRFSSNSGFDRGRRHGTNHAEIQHSKYFGNLWWAMGWRFWTIDNGK